MEREIRDLTGDDTFFIPYWDWSRASDCNICTCDLMGESNGDGRISSDSVYSKWETVCTYDDPYSIALGISIRRICAKRRDNDKAKHIQRYPGFANDCTGLPTATEVEAALSPEDYDTYPYDRHANNSFRNRLEGFDLTVNKKSNCAAMHNLVHDFFGGTLSQVPIAANDPLFMLHHAMVDRLFEQWLVKHRNMTYPESDTIPPVQRKENYMRPFFPPVRNDFLVNDTAPDLGYSYE